VCFLLTSLTVVTPQLLSFIVGHCCCIKTSLWRQHQAPYNQLDFSLVMMPWLGGYVPPSLQSWSHAPWFAAGANMKQAVTWLHMLDKNFLCVGIQTLIPQWDKCWNCQWWRGNLMCTICYERAIYTIKLE